MTYNAVFLLVIFFLVLNISLVAYILIRRLIRLPGEKAREARRQSSALMVDNFIIHAIEPTKVDVKAMASNDKRDKEALEYIITERLRLLKGESQWRLTQIYDMSGLTRDRMAELTKGGVWKRRMAAGVLGDAYAKRAISVLTMALRDPDEDVRLIAAKSLAKLRAVAALEYIVSLFRDLSESRCANVADAVISFGMPAGEPLIEMLRDPKEKARYWAAVSLSNIHIVSGHGECIVAANNMARMLPAEPSARVRAYICRTLGNIKMCDSTDALLPMLQDADAAVRSEAAAALGEIANPKSGEYLFKMLGDPVWEVNRAASLALLNLGPAVIDQAEIRLKAAEGIAGDRLREILDMSGRPAEVAT